MAYAATVRRPSLNETSAPESPERAIPGLPPEGCSPALDLQRRLGEAALRGFYAPEPRHVGVNMKRLVVTGATAVASWTVVFGAGALLLG